MKTKEREPMPTDDFYRDLFVGGYFDPSQFLENQKDVIQVQDAMITIMNYKISLEQNNLIQEI